MSCGVCLEYGPVWKSDMDAKPVVYMQPAHSTVKLRCEAVAKPRSTTTWFKDTLQLPARPHGKVRIGYVCYREFVKSVIS